MGLARYIGRAGALALALGVAIAMSAEPLVAHATRGERAAATLARRRAREAAWCTGMGLDDDLLDTPGYEPHCAWRPATGTGTAADDPLGVAP